MSDTPPAVHDIADALLALVGEALSTSDRRRRLVARAFGTQHPLLHQVDWEGAAANFAPRLVEAVLDFGEHAPGQQALAVLLRSLADEVGLEGQAELGRLAEEVDAADWTVRPGAEPSPAETSSLVLRLGRPPAGAAAPPLLFEMQREFNPGYARVKLRLGLARFLQIGLERVKVLSVAEGSVIAVVELPAERAAALEAAFAAGDPRLAQMLQPFVLREIVPLGRSGGNGEGDAGGADGGEGVDGRGRSGGGGRGGGGAWLRGLLGTLAVLVVVGGGLVTVLRPQARCWVEPEHPSCQPPPRATKAAPPRRPPTERAAPPTKERATQRPLPTRMPTKQRPTRPTEPAAERPGIRTPRVNPLATFRPGELAPLPVGTRLLPRPRELPDLVVGLVPLEEVLAIEPVDAVMPVEEGFAVPIRGEIFNAGKGEAGYFELSVHILAPVFGEPRQSYFLESRTWQRSFKGLPPGEAIMLDDLALLPPETKGQPVLLWLEVDSCAGAEFSDPEFCRVQESDEGNNRSNELEVLVE